MAGPVPDDETRQHGHATLSAGAIVAINFGVATTLLLGAFLLLYLVADEPRKLGGGLSTLSSLFFFFLSLVHIKNLLTGLGGSMAIRPVEGGLESPLPPRYYVRNGL